MVSLNLGLAIMIAFLILVYLWHQSVYGWFVLRHREGWGWWEGAWGWDEEEGGEMDEINITRTTMERCAWAFCMLKGLFLMLSVAAYWWWPARGGVLVVFASHATANFGAGACHSGLSFRTNSAISFLALVVGVPTMLFMYPFGVPVASMSYTAGMCICSIYAGGFVCLHQRQHWMRDSFYKAELA